MTSIQMPQLGETIVEGTILKWLKSEGDAVERDEPLFEISTDKVDTEVPSPVAGTVDEDHRRGGSDRARRDRARRDRGRGRRGGERRGVGCAGRGSFGVGGRPVPTRRFLQRPRLLELLRRRVPDRGPRSQILSPLVRRLAQEHGIDLATVEGSGTGGRITKGDVMAVVATGGAQPAAPSPAPGATASPATMAPPSVGAAAAQGETAEPMSHIRKAIASHMLASVNETARAWTTVEVNVDHLVRLRERSKDAFLQTHGVKLTYLPFVVRATVDALKAFPAVNSRIDGDQVVTPRAVHMGIAVSYDAGLIVPVIRDADVMNTVGLARVIADLAARARAHQLQPEEVQGATFTITNPGPYGSLISVPIINQPNAGILSLDAIQRRPVVVEGDAIAVRSMVYVSMSWDHRLLDGEVATRFLARVRSNLEGWDFAEDLGV